MARLSAVQEHRKNDWFSSKNRYVSRVTADKATLLAAMTFINLPYVVLVMAWWLLRGLLYFLLVLLLFFPSKPYMFLYLSGQSRAIIMTLSRATVL